jgi:hypothetical protein
MLTIEGRYFKATVESGDEGVDVIFWARTQNSRGIEWKFNSRGTIDKPFHVVCDEVHDIVTKAKSPPPVKHTVRGWNAAMTMVHCNPTH